MVKVISLHSNANKSRWLWLVIDPITKALPAMHVGGRKSEDAYSLLHDLKLRLEADSVPAFTSDGLRSYFYAITAHFGFSAKHRKAISAKNAGTCIPNCSTGNSSNARKIANLSLPLPAWSGANAVN